jgi:hypothetical protein
MTVEVYQGGHPDPRMVKVIDGDMERIQQLYPHGETPQRAARAANTDQKRSHVVLGTFTTTVPPLPRATPVTPEELNDFLEDDGDWDEETLPDVTSQP